MSELEIVYLVTNPAMPGLVKIGRTGRGDARARIGELYSTGVPVPFTLEYACRVKDGAEVERALHVAFGPQRLNVRREFFRIDPEQAIAILRLLHTEDATREVEAQRDGVDAESRAAADELRKRRPNLNFEEMGIPIGSLLESTHGPVTVTVVGPRRVRLGDEELSLSAATSRVLQLDYSIAPGAHWTFRGRRINAIYDETYGLE